MRTPNPILDNILSSSVNSAEFVLQIIVDEGTYYVSQSIKQVGSDSILPILVNLSDVSLESCSFSIATAQAPNVEWWINRSVRLYQVSDGLSAVADGYLIFDGIILGQPTEGPIALEFSCGLSRLNPKELPKSNAINLTDYPNAPKSSLNKNLPVVYGKVNRAELIPVDLPALSSLSRTARPKDTSIVLRDAEAFPESGAVVIDDVVYTYTNKDETTLYGLSITNEHQRGGQVSINQTAVYKGAEHALTAVDVVKAVGSEETEQERVLYNGVVDLANAQITFPYPPTQDLEAGPESIQAQFDQVEVSSTAINGINAIRAATGTETHNASSLPIDISDAEVGKVPFPEPVEQGGTSRIIAGVYTVNYAVTVQAGIPQLGKATVKIGDQIVWVWEGGQIIYNISPVTVEFDRDVNELPVRVELDGGLPGAFKVDILSASREVTVGNLDQAAYATLRKPSNTNLVVQQTTNNPNRGKIERARLVVEYFTTSQSLDCIEVYWDSNLLGKLDADNEANGGESVHTIDIDTISSGTAELITTAIENILTSTISRTDNAVSIPINVPIAYTIKEISGSPSQTIVYSLDTTIALPENLVGGTYQFTIESNDAAGGVNNASDVQLGDATFSLTSTSQTVFVTIPDNEKFLTLRHDTSFVVPTFSLSTSLFPTIKNIKGAVFSKPSENSITLDGGAVEGTSDVFDGTSNVSGVLTSANIDGTGAGTLAINIPTPPRTVVNSFDIVDVIDWSDLTNKTLQLNYVGGGTEDVGIVQAYVLVEYEKTIRAPATKIVANLTGKSGNPADVLKDLIEENQENVELLTYNALHTHFDNSNYVFSRRISSPTDVADLMRSASEQANTLIAKQENGNALIRLFDISSSTIDVGEQDILEFPDLSWSSTDDIENEITVNYSFDDSESAANLFAESLISKADIGLPRKVDYEARWIDDEVTAQQFLDTYLAVKSPMRRFLNLELPYTFSSLEEGDIINYEPLSSLFRVIGIVNSDGWLSVETEEIII